MKGTFMYFKTLIAAAIVSVAAVTTASASSVYSVYDHEIGGSPEHGLWFSGNNPPGAEDPKGNHFLFSNAAPGYGSLSIEDTGAATLSGVVKNAAGQGFTLEMNLMVDTTTPYDAKGPKGSPDISNWTFFSLESGTLKSLDSSLKDYDITRLMSSGTSPDDDPNVFGVQMGLGANDKDVGFGLSSWIFMRESGCQNCTELGGDINVSLIQAPLPAGAVLLPAGLALMGGLRMRRRKKAQS